MQEFAEVSRRKRRAATILFVAATLGINAYMAYKDEGNKANKTPVCAAEAIPSDISAVDRLLNSKKLRSTKPEDYGLSQPNANDVIQAYYYPETNPKLRPQFNRYLSAARNLTKLYGVEILMKRANDGYPGKIPQKNKLRTLRYENSMLDLMEGIDELPIEYVHMSGLKKIILADRTGVGGLALTGDRHDTVIIDLDGAGSPDVIDHEVYHLLDAAQCGGKEAAFNDAKFSSLNGKYKYGQKVLTYDDYISRYYKLYEESLGAKKAKDATKYERLKKENDKGLLGVVAANDHGMKNVVEDKAGIGEEIAWPHSYESVMKSPILKSKLELLLARIYHSDPEIVEYLTAVGAEGGEASSHHSDLP